MAYSPTDDELLPIVSELRKSNPSLGVSKFQALLLLKYPEWTVSEKRLKRILNQLGLGPNTSNTSNPNLASGGNQSHVFPISHLNETLRLEQWTSKVKVQYFGKEKGKGLVATDVIEAGEEIWKEDPFVVAPEWELFDAQRASAACAHCTTPLTQPSPLYKECTRSNQGCPAKFCSTLCRTRAQVVHPLLCPSSNAASIPLLRFCREKEWMSPHALTHCIARVLLANEKGKESAELKEVQSYLGSLAEISFLDWSKYIKLTPNHELWKEAFDHLVNAFRTPIESKKLARIVKQPLSPSIVPELFNYDAFLRGLGRMSLNLESHGGLYVLHSHINHSCEPNVSIRHLQQRTHLSRITALAKRRIEPGEELFITYINPELGVVARRRALREWNWGDCNCPRCVKEAKVVESEAGTGGGSGAGEEGARPEVDVVELEQELRDGLGLDL